MHSQMKWQAEFEDFPMRVVGSFGLGGSRGMRLCSRPGSNGIECSHKVISGREVDGMQGQVVNL